MKSWQPVLAMLIIALFTPVFAQTGETISTSVELVDKSLPSSPFKIEGKVRCSEWVDGSDGLRLRSRAEGDANITNTSHGQIVAWAAKARTNCLHAGPHEVTAIHDHFFKDDNMADDNWKVPLGFDEGTQTSEDSKEKNPHDVLLSSVVTPTLTGEITFVQFDDGSVWGSSDIFARVKSGRAVAMKFLQRLTSSSLNEAEFRAILTEDQPHNSVVGQISSQLQAIQSKSGVGAAIDKARDALRSAERRQDSGRF